MEYILVFDIQGMSCISCAQRIESTLSKQPFVKEVNVDLAAKKAFLTALQSGTGARITKIIKGLGYEAQENRLQSLAKKEYAVAGMSCTACAQRIEEGLSKQQGVSTATVDFARKQLSVAYNEKQVNPKQFKQLVKEMGYTLTDRG